MAEMHDALALVDERLNNPKPPKPVTVGKYQKPKPILGFFTEAINVAALFPKASTPWVLGGSKWEIESDDIPSKLDDSNMESLVTTDNRIGGQVIRTHDFPSMMSTTKNFFARVGETIFKNVLTQKSVVTPGVNLTVFSDSNDKAGQTSITVGAQQGSISKIIGESDLDPTPANKFGVSTAFLQPLGGMPGLLALSIQRTQFPHLFFRYQLWDTQGEELADIGLSLPPTYCNPLALMLPTVTITALYEISPGQMAKPIEFSEARKLFEKHKSKGNVSDPMTSSLASIQRSIEFADLEKVMSANQF